MRRSDLVLILGTVLSACARPHYAAPPAAGVTGLGEAPACGARLGPECVSVRWERVAFGGRNYSAFLLKIGRPNLGDGSLVVTDGDYDLDVELWMPEMGHGTGPVHVARVDVGTYRVTHVYLPHGGRWEIRVKQSPRAGGPGAQAALRFTL